MLQERRAADVSRIVIISNRVPDVSGQKKGHSRPRPARSWGPAGGLVSAIHPALQEKGGIWFGWSGKTLPRQLSMMPKSVIQGNINFLTVDLSESEVENYYTGFSNRSMWPLIHSFPARVRVKDEEFKTYLKVNLKFAHAIYPYLRAGDLVWVHDFHVIPMGTNLRRLGWDGPIGFFLHEPFPAPDVFFILPWARRMLEDFLGYDLIGFHTERYRRNFEDSLEMEMEGNLDGHVFKHGSSKLRIGVYPVGIDRESFQDWAKSPRALKQVATIKKYIGNRLLILGVDRLDYTKGIIERLRAFEKLLDRFPSWKRKVSMIQISAPSRTRVPEYISQKRQVDQTVGEINGRLADADWVPVSYLYRSYDQQTLAGFYRVADVCFVSPLRDGMNLVCKEYVASQSDDPGVLVLSRFCGAAEDLKEAIIVNPYDIDGTARALKRALEMPLGERKDRWLSLIDRVSKNSARAWRNRFLGDLAPKEYELFPEEDMQEPQLQDSVRFPLNETSPTERKADIDQSGK